MWLNSEKSLSEEARPERLILLWTWGYSGRWLDLRIGMLTWIIDSIWGSFTSCPGDEVRMSGNPLSEEMEQTKPMFFFRSWSHSRRRHDRHSVPTLVRRGKSGVNLPPCRGNGKLSAGKSLKRRRGAGRAVFEYTWSYPMTSCEEAL